VERLVAAGEAVEVAAQPAGPALGPVTRHPPGGRREVAEVGRDVADPLDDGELAGVEPALQVRQLGVEPHTRADGQGIGGLDRDARPLGVVGRVAGRHDGVEAVVAAAQLDGDEHAVLRADGRGRAGQVGQPARQQGGGSHPHGAGLQEAAAAHAPGVGGSGRGEGGQDLGGVVVVHHRS
jgi:hypothetical protein